MARGDGLDVTVRGDREVIRALEALPPNARREVRRGAVDLSRDLATAIRAGGRASDRQSGRASRTVRAVTQGTNPAVTAGPHPLLFGSEFGVIARFGWYRKGRYHASPKRQFRPRTPGNVGYWFFPTYVRERPRIREAHQEMADAVIRQWSA